MPDRETSPVFIRMHAADNVVIVANDGGLKAGTALAGVTLLEDIPQGHKVAVQDIAGGDPVIRYGVCVGVALEPLREGSWVRESLLGVPPAPSLEAVATLVPEGVPPMEPLEGHTFEGYRNADGSVGTLNLLGITATVNCVEGVLNHAVRKIREELLPRYPRVDGVVALNHGFGCGVAIDAPDAGIPIGAVRNLALNPNFGGVVMVVRLGCEKMEMKHLFPEGEYPGLRGGIVTVTLQDGNRGFSGMVETILAAAGDCLEILDARRRQTCPASSLVLGMQCGGSDAFSGITANPAIGFAADLLVRAGATVLFSEMSEIRDRVDFLAKRAVSREVAADLAGVLAWNDAYLARGGADRTANSSPGNKAGGLNNIAEKSMGTLAKTGTTPLVGVIGPGEKLPEPRPAGLYFCATPACDFLCGPLQLAAGMNLHVFTTGRGTPYGLEAVPVIKVSSRNALYDQWPDLIDVNAGPIATGEATVEEKGWELFRFYLDVAGGRKKTWSQHWGLYNSLSIFNPVPRT